MSGRAERGLRTRHMDQHLNSRLLTPWVPHGWSRCKVPEDAEIPLDLPHLQRMENYAQAANPVSHWGILVSSYQMSIVVIRLGEWRLWRKLPENVMASLPLRMVFYVEIRSSQNSQLCTIPIPPLSALQ